MDNFKDKLRLYIKIIFVGFFVSAIPYFISDFWITTLDLKNGFWKTFLILFSRIFISGTVYMFTEEIKNVFDGDVHWGWLLFRSIFLSIVYLSLLTHNIIY